MTNVRCKLLYTVEEVQEAQRQFQARQDAEAAAAGEELPSFADIMARGEAADAAAAENVKSKTGKTVVSQAIADLNLTPPKQG